MTRMYVVVPCYNEEAVLMETASRLRKKLEELTAQGRIAPGSRVLFVNDGSKDRTWELIAQLHREQPEVFSGLKLSFFGYRISDFINAHKNCSAVIP